MSGHQIIMADQADFLDEDGMTSNSAAKVASQQSIKAYVDAQTFGGLSYTPVTVTTLDVYASEGNAYYLTIAGQNANRSFFLPTPSGAGQQVSVNIVDGDQDYEIVVVANTFEIARIFASGDHISYISTGTNPGDWIEVIDGRVKTMGVRRRNSSQVIPTNTWTMIQAGTSDINVGWVTNVIADTITARRDGRYLISGMVTLQTVTDQSGIRCAIYKNGSSIKQSINTSSDPTSVNHSASVSAFAENLVAGDDITLYAWHDVGSDRSTTSSSDLDAWFSVVEL